MAFFKTHPNHIPVIKAYIEAVGPVWFHGDGNIYHSGSQMSSADAAKYARRLPGRDARPGPGAYRVQFNSVNDVPDTVDEINEMLLRLFAKEQAVIANPVSANKPAVVHVPGTRKEAPVTVDKEAELTAAQQAAEQHKAAAEAAQAEIESLKKQLEKAKKKASNTPADGEAPANNQ